jgi:hypothetical protein
VEQARLTGLMQGAWVSFARDPWKGLEREFGWPVWKEGEEMVVRLGWGNGDAVSFVRAEVYSGGCEGVVLAGGK